MPKNLVRPTSKGQVTIPKAIRQKMNVDVNTFLSIAVEKNAIVLRPVSVKTKNEDTAGLRVYTDEQIAEFQELDKLSPENAAFLNRVLKTDKY